MPIINDKEFGDITIRRSAKSSSMRVSIAPNGTLRVSAPSYAPLFMVKRMIASSREELRLLRNRHPKLELRDGMSIGKSHSLLVRPETALRVTRQQQQIIVHLPADKNLSDDDVVAATRVQIIAALRREAKHYLPKRLDYLASQHGFSYKSVRFSHASGRWGSCNHLKAISLNIALMNLPFELIDYVIIHELSHTVHLDHSAAFWQMVATADPDFKAHRKLVKAYSPSV